MHVTCVFVEDLFTLARFTGPPTTGLTSGRSGTQREYKKLQLVLFDDASNIAIKLTAWDNFVDDFNRYSDEERISVAIRGAKVVIHDRIISLETISTTIFKVYLYYYYYVCVISHITSP